MKFCALLQVVGLFSVVQGFAPFVPVKQSSGGDASNVRGTSSASQLSMSAGGVVM